MAEASSLPEYSLYPILEPDRALTSINAIVQDSTGFLWFASQHGLHRYDGKSYKSYYSDSLSTTLLNAHFLTAHYDFKGRIWLGTLHGGFHLFDPLYETFFPFIIPSSNPKDNTISYFANAPSDSFLYILTGGHKIYRFNLNSLRLDNSDALDFINHSADIKKIYAIYLWDANTIWLGVDENRLVKFNLKNKTKRIYSLPDSPRLQPGRIRHITKNRFRRLLITYNKKALYDFNPETGFFNLIYPVGDSRDHINESFLRSFEDQYGNYWLSASKDLIHIDPTSYHSRVYNVYFPDANPMESNNRYPLFEDRQGILWTTTNKGVHRLIRKSPVYYHLDTKDSEFQKNNNNIIATLAADYKNQIWLGGQSGLYRIEKNRKELINVDLSEKWSSSRIYKLLEHPAGTLWIAGNNFLGNIDVNTGNIKSLFDSTGFRNLFIQKNNQLLMDVHLGPVMRMDIEPPYSAEIIPLLNDMGDTLYDYVGKNLYVDKKERLWIIAESKVFYTDSTQKIFKSHSFQDSIGDTKFSLSRFFHDSKGYLWITDNKSGLFRIDPDLKKVKIFRYNPSEPLGIPSNGITMVTEDNEGTIWLGTFLSGMAFYDREKDLFYTYMQNAGLGGNSVYNIHFDKNNNLWVCTNRGLSYMDKKTENFINFHYEEGFSFNIISANAILEHQDMLYIGNQNGAFILTPYNQDIPQNLSRTIISGLKINNKYVRPNQPDEEGRIILNKPLIATEAIRLLPKDLMVTFEFTHLDYINPERNQYAYMLEGLEKDFHYVGNQNKATYTFLPPGNFTLKVKASNAYGAWSSNTTDLKITVIPPFYSRIWFLVLIASIILGIIILFYQVRTFSIRRHNEALQTINKRLEDEIIERELIEKERLRLISAIEQSIDAIMITDTKGNIRYVNPAFDKMTGYNRNEVIGQHIRLLKSGKQTDSFYGQMWKMIGSGAVWSGKLINMRSDGTLITVEETITPVRDDSGEIINYVAIMRDITEQEKIEKDLHQAQKMQAIGTLAGGIAHDFNNILSSISLNADIILSNTYGQSDIQEDANEIQVAAYRGKELVEQILTFSRQGENKAEMIQVETIFQSVNRMLRATIPATIQIDSTVEPCPPIFGNATHIYQIILNLATNARDAITGTGKITIVLKPISKELSNGVAYNGLRPDDYIYISVSDTGKGIPKDLLSRVFDPFFTTKEVGRGTGMGLAIVHGIVQKYDGHISVKSKEYEGTTFEVFLSQKGLNKTV